MGEKEGKDKKNEKNRGGEAKKEGGGGGKKDDGPAPIVMKTDIHCEGCARKIKNSLKNFQGVDSVATDVASNKVTVTGKVDPVKIRERVESKTRKKVELITPGNAPKESDTKKAQADNSNKEQKKKADDKKPKEPAASTVTLSTRLHCDECIQRTRKIILKIKGVEAVEVDAQKDLVTVKGTMDVNTLPSYLKQKLRRAVAIVPPKKEEKKEKGVDKGGDVEKKGGGGGEKKNEGAGKKEQSSGGGQKQAEAPKMEYYYGQNYEPYHIEMARAPQMFSDENPNACSVM